MSGVSAADVPDRFDAVFQLSDGTLYGFLLSDALESNLPFRTHKATYGYSPTFLERQNVSDLYGDNFQDFFLTGSQDDFSLGEQQKYFKVNDVDRSRRYWGGLNVDPVSNPGNVVLTSKLINFTSSCNASTAVPWKTGWAYADQTNLYTLTTTSTTATQTSQGAHGLPIVTALTTDFDNIYMSNGQGTVIKQWNGTIFSTFSPSANGCDILVYLNNTLYGYQAATDSLISFDTSGSPTTQFQWKNADGSISTVNQRVTQMINFGGILYMIRMGANCYEIWKYDASGVAMLGQLPTDFVVTSICKSQGILFISGYRTVSSNFSATQYENKVFYYVNGSIGKLWSNPVTNNINTQFQKICIAAYDEGIVIWDPITNNVLQYNIALGGVHTIANFAQDNTSFGVVGIYSTNQFGYLLFLNYKGAPAAVYGASSSYPSTGYIETSQYTFDNTLSKIMRGIKVDVDLPTNTSVDILYQLDGCGGAYTNLQTGAASGVEYKLPASTSAHSISVKVNLNTSDGVNSPNLKRVYIRAAPTLQQFRRREFIFDLSGGYRETKGKVARVCRDGTPYPYDGYTASLNLVKIATQVVPFTVYDRFTTSGYTALADLQQNQAGYDGFAIYEIHPGVYLARINIREV